MLHENDAILNPPPPAPPSGRQKPAALEIRDLRKIYRAQGGQPASIALKGISLRVEPGEIYGLLGPNGAGKSTCINILAGMAVKSSGAASVWGFDIDIHPRQARASIGVVPQELQIDPFFTPNEILDLQAGLYGVPPAQRRTGEVLAVMGLAAKADAYTRTLSGGMRRRLMIAKAMVHDPPVLVLDEPTAGVDVELRRQLWDYVRVLNARGVTILLTTHYLEEAQNLCGRIAIINHGVLVAEDETHALLDAVEGSRIKLRPAHALAAVPQAIAGLLLPSGARAELTADGWLDIHYRPRQLNVGQILAACAQAGLEIADLEMRAGSLEDAFLRLTSDSKTPAAKI